MVWIVVVVLLVLWTIGLLTSHTFSGAIHVLLIAALIVMIVNVIQGRGVTW